MIKNIIIIVLFFLFLLLGIFYYFSPFLNFIGKPFWKIKNKSMETASNLGYVVRTKSSIYKQNEVLMEENANLRVSMVDYQIIKTENEQLKEQLGRTSISKNLVLANILTKPSYSPYDTLILDIGSKNGIRDGNKVYSNGSIPVGEVTSVYDDTSLVTLYSNPGKVTEASMDGSNTNIELVGRGGGNFETTIPTDLQFVKGGIIYIPGISSEVVAIIEDVISSPTDPVKKLLLSSPVNVQNLKWVFVEK